MIIPPRIKKVRGIQKDSKLEVVIPELSMTVFDCSGNPRRSTKKPTVITAIAV
jgi:hypothetical protein